MNDGDKQVILTLLLEGDLSFPRCAVFYVPVSVSLSFLAFFLIGSGVVHLIKFLSLYFLT